MSMQTRIALFFVLHGVVLAVPLSLAALDSPTGTTAPDRDATPAAAEYATDAEVILASF